MRIAILGLGMVAMADALALAVHHDVTVTGPVPDRIDAIRRGEFGLTDPALAVHLAERRLALTATLDTAAAVERADMVILAMPLPVDPVTGRIDTTEIDSRIDFVLARAPQVPVVIRSAVPMGFAARQRRAHPGATLIVAPEQLREGTPLSDRLNQPAVIVGDRGPLGAWIGEILAARPDGSRCPVRQMGAAEAEAVKHMAQAVLAARVAFFNELDSYALAHDLDARQIIAGVVADPRIGAGTANPCFGYAARVLPRSAATLAEALADVPICVLPGLEGAADRRIGLIADRIAAEGARRVGLVGGPAPGPMARLAGALADRGLTVAALAPDGSGAPDTDCDLIVAQRMTPALAACGGRVFCRDIFAGPPG